MVTMRRTIPERDWKYMRRLKDDLLARLFRQINSQSLEILKQADVSDREKYRTLYAHIRDSDKIVADCFDDWRRSTLMEKVFLLCYHGLLEEDIQELSEETQERVRAWQGL